MKSISSCVVSSTVAHSVTLIMLFGVITIPLSTFAASNSRPSCSLTATTSAGSITTNNTGTLYIVPNDTLSITWQSLHAKTAQMGKNSIALNGSATTTPSSTTNYSYSFKDGSKKVTCSLTVVLTTASIDTSSRTIESGKPVISGTVTGVKSVRVSITDASGKNVYSSKDIKVQRDAWQVAVGKVLADGTYTVTVTGDSKILLNVIATGSLSVGVPPASIHVTYIPLLSGGTARPGATVPISYLQVMNTGQSPVTIKGFWIKQNGSAPTSAIIGLSTVDDKGGSRGAIGGAEGTSPFVNGLAYVPTASATILAGQMKLFTVKAQLSSNSGSFVGTTLMLDVANVDAPATIKASFPIPGTTWTITR